MRLDICATSRRQAPLATEKKEDLARRDREWMRLRDETEALQNSNWAPVYDNMLNNL
jgi:hypothetical protein